MVREPPCLFFFQDNEQPIVFYQYDDTSGDWLECGAPQTITFEEDVTPGTITMATVEIESDIFLLLANTNVTYSTSSPVNNTNFYQISFFNETLGMPTII